MPKCRPGTEEFPCTSRTALPRRRTDQCERRVLFLLPAPGHIGNRAKRRTGAGKVLLRADGRVAHSNALRFQRDFRQSKIENLCLTSVREEDVRRLDVSVDDALRMCGVESIGNLDAQIEHSFTVQRLALNLMPERLPSSSSIAMKARPSTSSIS